jgi:HPt (histidine-containing phosphotransfer) domain-containing protein
MGIRRFKLIGIIASCAVVIVCVSLLAWLNMALAVVCILCSFAASTVTYYKIDNKRLRFEANTDTICKECKKQFAKAAVADMSQADGVVNQPVAAGTSDDEVDTAAQSGEVVSLAVDEAGFHKMIDMFVNDMPNCLKEMQEALQEGNLQDLAFKVHALKSLDGFAGFGVYTEKAEALEQAVMDNQIDKVREQLDEMIQLCLKTKPAHH